MNKSISLLLTSISLLSTGCAGLHPVETPPQIIPVEAQYHLPAVRIRWIPVSVADFDKFSFEYQDYLASVGSRVAGIQFAGLTIPPLSDDPDPRCVILVPEPRYHDDMHMRVLGHEVVHCFRGLWHPAWGSESTRPPVGGGERAVRLAMLRLIKRYLPQYVSEIEEFLK